MNNNKASHHGRQGFPGKEKAQLQSNVVLREDVYPNYIKQILLTPVNKNYIVFKNISFQLRSIKKDFSWLTDQVKIYRTTYNGIVTGKDNISMELIYRMAYQFKSHGARIQSPKSLMNPRNIALKYFDMVKNNIHYLKTRYCITTGELVEGTGIDRGNMSLLLRNISVNPRHETLLSVFNFYRSKGIYLETPLDLIYFPEWGETQSTYEKYHRKKSRYENFKGWVKISPENRRVT